MPPVSSRTTRTSAPRQISLLQRREMLEAAEAPAPAAGWRTGRAPARSASRPASGRSGASSHCAPADRAEQDRVRALRQASSVDVGQRHRRGGRSRRRRNHAPRSAGRGRSGPTAARGTARPRESPRGRCRRPAERRCWSCRSCHACVGRWLIAQAARTASALLAASMIGGRRSRAGCRGRGRGRRRSRPRRRWRSRRARWRPGRLRRLVRDRRRYIACSSAVDPGRHAHDLADRREGGVERARRRGDVGHPAALAMLELDPRDRPGAWRTRARGCRPWTVSTGACGRCRRLLGEQGHAAGRVSTMPTSSATALKACERARRASRPRAR